jgi:hypothetical protein
MAKGERSWNDHWSCSFLYADWTPLFKQAQIQDSLPTDHCPPITSLTQARHGGSGELPTERQPGQHFFIGVAAGEVRAFPKVCAVCIGGSSAWHLAPKVHDGGQRIRGFQGSDRGQPRQGVTRDQRDKWRGQFQRNATLTKSFNVARARKSKQINPLHITLFLVNEDKQKNLDTIFYI